MSTNPLAGLNAPQREAVIATEGPVLVLAGAGSGKTRVLTHRIAYLIQTGKAAPGEIFAVTFTNKAAREMRERVQRLLGSAQAPTAIGTFHGLSARLLREQHQYIGRTAGFTIADTGDSERLIKQALEAQGLNAKQWPPRRLREAISRAKNKGWQPADMAASAEHDAEAVTAQVYERYQKLLKQNDMLDFDDLISATITLLQEHSQVQAQYRNRWSYLSVDEYQDTNPAQDMLLKLLLGPARNVCAVGDDYQAIYSWRGARVDHILRFEQSFPGCQVVYLTQNYRSTAPILTAANRIIAENREQKHKELWTERKEGSAVRLMTLSSDIEEARTVCRLIREKQKEGAASGHAILYRTNAQSRVLEEELVRQRMPYVIVGGLRFYERAEVKDALAMLTALVNPRASLAVRRAAGVVAYGVGPKTVDKVLEAAAAAGIPFWEAVLQNTGVVTDRQAGALRPLSQAMRRAAQAPGATVGETLEQLLKESGYLIYLGRLPDGEERQENIAELFSVAAGYTEIAAFLETAALMGDTDETARARGDEVLCMTMHAAKGLEFPYVYVVGCEEGLLPHQNSFNSPADLEEERRLLYVGMTRAREQLTLSYALERMVRGERLPQVPSRFLSALPPEVERLSSVPMPAAAVASNEPVYISCDIGDMITHPIFGRGVVIEVNGSTLTGVFEGYGMKTITM